MRVALMVEASLEKVRLDGENSFCVENPCVIVIQWNAFRIHTGSPEESTVVWMMRLFLGNPSGAVASKLTGWHSSVLCVCLVFEWLMAQKGHSTDSMYLCLQMSFPFSDFLKLVWLDLSSVGLDNCNYLQLWLEGRRLWRNSSVS